MAVSAADVISPMFTATEVVVFFFPGVAGQARFRDLLGSLVLERDDFRRVAFCDVIFAGSMTRLAPGDFVLPAPEIGQLRV
jgi:hypothetical protein